MSKKMKKSQKAKYVIKKNNNETLYRQFGDMA